MADLQKPAASLTLAPTPRLARALKQRMAAQHVAEGAQAWRAPEVISFSAWLGKLRGEALMAGATNNVPISGSQARLLWQQVIDTEVFVGEPRVHALAERAWRTIHEYGLQHPRDWPESQLSDDSRQFRDWVARFEQLCEERGVIDEWSFAAAVPALIAEHRLALPDRIDLTGFELPPSPLQTSIFEALKSAGVELQGLGQIGMGTQPDMPALTLHQFSEPDDELRAAAEWARARLEFDSAQAIAIVVPDLAGRLARVERILRQVFDPPGYALAESGTEPWHVSLGLPLAQWALVADALLLLGLDPSRIDQPTAGRVLASPYLAGAEAEERHRASSTAGLMQWSPFEITGFELMAACSKAGANKLGEQLGGWRALRDDYGDDNRSNKRQKAWPSEWIERFQKELKTLGFGRGRPLDSREFQVLGRWHELLEEFGELDAVIASPVERRFALSLLAERAKGATFRERNPGCPVEILGVEEALGSEFDAMWITTLDADTWPGAVRRDPLIPGPVQAGVPAASSNGKLQRARLELAGVARAAEDTIGSFSTGSDDQQRQHSRLLQALPVIKPLEVVDPEPETPLERIADDTHAPVLDASEVRGGTGVLSDQSACPFRAFAARRLGARELASPRPGLDAAARGNLIHVALELFWSGLTDRAALAALAPEELEQRIAAAAEHALGRFTQAHRLLLSPAGRRLEQRCTHRTLARWIELERTREAFRVHATERRIAMDFAGLKLEGKIDRIDETPAGTVLIDYKTGRAGRNGWRPDARIADPQLPAYALAMDPRPAALTFARIRPDELKFDGLAEADAGIPGVSELAAAKGAWKETDDWNTLLEAWQDNLNGLALSFQEGRAEVDPRDGYVCRTCHLHALCRIHERQVFSDAGGET